MRVPLTLVFAMVFAAAAFAQQSSTGTRQGSTPAHESSRASADTEFAMKAAHANMAEVELGKLAHKKAMNDEVKQFARRMIDDHGKSLDELKTIASKKHLTLPSGIDAEHRKLADRLSNMSGSKFDSEYIDAMVDGHRKVASDFRKESQSGADPDLKAYAAKTLPVVEQHLEQAEMIKSNLRSSSATR